MLHKLINQIKNINWAEAVASIRHFDWNSKQSRRSLVVIIIAIAVFVVIPSLFMRQSFNAVVNTRFVVIYSPIEGHIEGFNKEAGDAVTEGEILLSINNTVKNQSFKKQLAELERLKSELTDKVSLNTGFEARRIDWQLVEAYSELEGEKLILKATNIRIKELAPLYRDRLVTRYRYEDDIRSAQTSKTKIDMLQARIDRILLEKEALYAGIRMGEGRNDVPYTRQRIDEVTMQIAEVTAKVGLNGSAGSYPVPAPITGFVWQKSLFNNSEVVIGSEIAQIANCKDLFVEAEVSENVLEKIELGSSVKYRLRGDDTYYTGQVISKVGAGSTLTDKTLAASLPLEKGSAKITVKINPNDLDPNLGNRCHIGRKVEVKLPRSWNPFSWLTRIVG